MAKKAKVTLPPPVTREQIDACVAYTVAEGDLVNFRFLFFPYSPLRDDSTEDIDSDKYAYLRPTEEEQATAAYQQALQRIREPDMAEHIRAQLSKKGPAQLPAPLVLMLADNAVRLRRFGAAAQAYELLRIRRRMRETFFDAADRAWDAGNIECAVRGYRAGSRLTYDYAAFPEPLPITPNYHARALLLHAEYPQRPEDSLPLQPTETLVTTALDYLLLDAEAAARAGKRPLRDCIAFIAEWVRAGDPEWDAFTARYDEAVNMASDLARRMQQEANRWEGVEGGAGEALGQEEIARDAHEIPARLLGRRLDGAEWWQYMKELAYQHPAAALFVTRQAITHEVEVIMPRRVLDSELYKQLGLTSASEH